MMRNLLLSLVPFLLIAASCNNNAETKKEAVTEKNAPAAEPQSRLNQDGTRKLMSMVTDYYELKDALVATSAAKADAAMNKLQNSTEAMKAYLQNDSANAVSLVTYLDTITARGQMLQSMKDESTETKRAHFEKISDAMFALLKEADLKHAGIYRQYCPMAFNDKGAYWLSNEEDIKNPYFGKKMLTCGEVRDSLK